MPKVVKALVVPIILALTALGCSVLYRYIQRTNERKLVAEEQKSVYSRMARELPSDHYGEFEFGDQEIRVIKSGRIFKKMGIPNGSILVEGNGVQLKTESDLGQAIFKYYKTNKLTLKWNHRGKPSEGYYRLSRGYKDPETSRPE